MKRLGRTELDVFPLGLGGIPLARLDRQEAERVIKASMEGGINLAETARGYGDSEDKLSYALRNDRAEFIIASKSPRRTAREMSEDIEQSLRRLKTDFIDIYQMHNVMDEDTFDRVFAPGGAMEALTAARDVGKIRFIGITGHRPSILIKSLKVAEFHTVQVPVNAVQREAEDSLIPLAKEMGVGVFAMKPVCGGALDHPALGIRYCMQSEADIVLCGMKNVDEVSENLDTAINFMPLSEDEEETLFNEMSMWGREFCRRCDYCQPCPHGVEIPKILWLANHRRRYGDSDPWSEKEYLSMAIDASYCEECGECEEACPYELPIRRMLKEAHDELVPSRLELARRKVRDLAHRAVPFKKDSIH